ncbi:MAG TPA: hypothetical protein VFQ57_02165 [Sphingomonas sp.]|jgi:hypothetical protein|nr:hypothetical protein [Sphingomonas sp.]
MSFHLADAGAVVDATDLIARFGNDAFREAADLARAARDLGNHIRFCRWRQIERLIVLLTGHEVVGTLH